MRKPADILHWTLSVAFLTLCTHQAGSFAKPDRPVKVFILAGQSNMEGKALASTLDAVIGDPAMRDEFKHLKKGDKWA
ncbi:MAG: hypothetical protein ACYS8Z_01200, partial [Planctomycetota bacterium]